MVITDKVKLSKLSVTVLVVYDGKFLDSNHIFDRLTILVEGAIETHHLARIQSLLRNHEIMKYRDATLRHKRQDQIVYEALAEWGYRVINKSIICNIDFTEPDTP